MTPAGNEHGKIAMSVAWRLAQHVEAHGLGAVYAAETGFRLASDPDTVRAPDAAFVSQARLDAVGAVAGYWPGAPDLVVEVVSPGDRYGEVAEKVADWLAAGTQMVVVVEPQQADGGGASDYGCCGCIARRRCVGGWEGGAGMGGSGSGVIRLVL